MGLVLLVNNLGLELIVDESFSVVLLVPLDPEREVGREFVVVEVGVVDVGGTDLEEVLAQVHLHVDPERILVDEVTQVVQLQGLLLVEQDVFVRVLGYVNLEVRTVDQLPLVPMVLGIKNP